MIRTRLIHPQLLSVLAQTGHGNQILVANAHYPAATNVPPSASRVYLNLAPGIISFQQVVQVLRDVIEIESATGILTADKQIPPVAREIRALLPETTELHWLPRFEFYEMVKNPLTMAVVVTGEQRMYTNLLLTIGVIKAGE